MPELTDSESSSKMKKEKEKADAKRAPQLKEVTRGRKGKKENEDEAREQAIAQSIETGANIQVSAESSVARCPEWSGPPKFPLDRA